MNATWYCFFPVRDGEDTIRRVMDSLVNQTYKPSRITIAEDGSSDGTAAILKEFEDAFPGMVRVIHTGSKTRDYKRLVKLWNMSLERGFDYHMIGAGDCIFGRDYAEKILSRMEEEPDLVIASGRHAGNELAPTGGGRFVRQSWFYENYEAYPEIMGYESEIMYRAMLGGYGIKVFDEHYEHADQLGHSHNFSEFGQGMRALGYHPLYVLARCVLSFSNPNFTRRGVFNMFWKYLTYRPEATGYYSMFPKDVRDNIRRYQAEKIRRRLGRIFGSK